MTDLLLEPGLRPFLAAAIVVLAMLGLEVVLVMLGLSGDTGAEADLDAEFDFDAEPDLAPAQGFDLEADTTAAPQQGLAGRAATIFGLGLVPLTIWIALVAALFACLGLAGQSALHGITGRMLPPNIAMALAALPALALAARAARFTARLIPRTTTSAISERAYGRRRGVVTVGAAAAGNPAQVRFSDQHGNTHHLMAEPMDQSESIPEGSEVLIIRTREGQFRLVRTN